MFTLAALMWGVPIPVEKMDRRVYCVDVSEAPNPQGASGREWCYVEPQVDLCVTWDLYPNKFCLCSWLDAQAKKHGAIAVCCQCWLCC